MQLAVLLSSIHTPVNARRSRRQKAGLLVMYGRKTNVVRFHEMWVAGTRALGLSGLRSPSKGLSAVLWEIELSNTPVKACDMTQALSAVYTATVQWQGGVYI